MKYYKVVDIEQHYPYAKEIAEQLGYGWDKRLSLFIGRTLNDDLKEKGLDQLFYNTKYGLRQVYQNYELAFEDDFKDKVEKFAESIESDYIN